MVTEEPGVVRRAVRERYGQIARQADDGGGAGSGCCGETEGFGGCCGGETGTAASARLGYSPVQLTSVPDGADMGLGCGNPQAVAGLKPGETVLDLGSGGGLDCFLASSQVGPEGRVIGVDMTPDMVEKARVNASVGGYANVEFRLGEIEHLPVADNSIDAIISNCVINLSPDKPAVYAEAMRVLRPGGRLAISDVVATAEIPDEARHDMDLLTGCVSGASSIAELEGILTGLGFRDVRIQTAAQSKAFMEGWAPGSDLRDYVGSATVEAVKPL